MIAPQKFGRHRPLTVRFLGDVEVLTGRQLDAPASNLLMMRNANGATRPEGSAGHTEELPNLELVIQFEHIQQVSDLITTLEGMRRNMRSAAARAKKQQQQP